MAVALDIVARIPLFEGVKDETLESVTSFMKIRAYASNEVVMHKGDAPESLAFLLNGKLQVVDISEDGRETGLHFIAPGSYFGELSVIDGKPRSATVMAIQASEVAFLPIRQARELIFNHPLIAQRFLTRFANILRASSNQRMLLSIPNAFQRVFAQLHLIVQDAKEGQVIEGLPKQHEIAIMANTSRETVSRALQALLKSNILVKKGTVLIIKRPDMLKNAATGGAEALTSTGRTSPESKN